MEYTYLGDTGLKVSRLCLGCAGLSGDSPPDEKWEWTVNDEAQSLEILDHAIENGINFIDTSNIYSWGESERLVGKAIAERRDELVVATKVGSSIHDRPNGWGLSRKHIIEQAKGSLERLGTDYIDLYQLHRRDPNTPIEETLSALDYLVDEGMVRYVGASNMASWELVKALYTSDVNNFERFVCVQPEYNLVARHEEENVLPVAEDQQLGVISYAPLAAGFLTGMYDRESDAEKLRADDDSYLDLGTLATEENWQVLDEVRALADQKDATPVQISVSWLLHKDIVDAPIIGPQNLDHLDEYLRALDVSLSEDEIARLEEPITPTWSLAKLNL